MAFQELFEEARGLRKFRPLRACIAFWNWCSAVLIGEAGSSRGGVKSMVWVADIPVEIKPIRARAAASRWRPPGRYSANVWPCAPRCVGLLSAGTRAQQKTPELALRG